MASPESSQVLSGPMESRIANIATEISQEIGGGIDSIHMRLREAITSPKGMIKSLNAAALNVRREAQLPLVREIAERIASQCSASLPIIEQRLFEELDNNKGSPIHKVLERAAPGILNNLQKNAQDVAGEHIRVGNISSAFEQGTGGGRHIIRSAKPSS